MEVLLEVHVIPECVDVLQQQGKCEHILHTCFPSSLSSRASQGEPVWRVKLGNLASRVKVSLVGGWLNWRKKLIPAYLVASSRSQKCFRKPMCVEKGG